MLKYKACDFCDDVFGEVADVVFGDAWVEKYATASAVTKKRSINPVLVEG